ncbi:unnamed protein product [Porites lobata]|uniref:G-protein coupled receptors family 1 profile domain-containing protein n=1 Tax=Porites lobata TaxID=104759 RepID=A0ABN8RXH5_9CNID|nr:unnamed protein product [Porites lobata]
MENSIEIPTLNEEPVFIVALQVIFVLLLIIFGLIGNFSACAMVYTHRHLQTVPNFLIVNLSISDILRIAFTLLVSTGVLIKRQWIFNETLCRVNGCYTLTFLLASLMSVTIISANRYFLIVRPSESATFFSKRRTRAMVVLLWFLAVFSALPPNFGWGHYGFFASRATCFIAVGSSYSYTTFLVLAFIATPFSVLIWCYFKIYMAIRRSRRRVMEQGVRTLARTLSAEGKESRIHKEVKVAKTVLLLIGVYIVTWIPILVIHFLRVARIGYIPDSVDLAAAFLMSMSCVTNPWIYGYRNRHFRDQLRRMLCITNRVTHLVERQQVMNNIGHHK